MKIIWSEQAMEAIADTTEYIFEKYRSFLATKINKLIYRVNDDGNIYVSVFWDCRRDPATLSNLVD